MTASTYLANNGLPSYKEKYEDMMNGYSSKKRLSLFSLLLSLILLNPTLGYASSKGYQHTLLKKAPSLDEFTSSTSSCIATSHYFLGMINQNLTSDSNQLKSEKLDKYKKTIEKLTAPMERSSHCARDMRYCMTRWNLTCESYFDMRFDDLAKSKFTKFLSEFLEAYNKNEIESLTSFPSMIDCTTPLSGPGGRTCIII